MGEIGKEGSSIAVRELIRRKDGMEKDGDLQSQSFEGRPMERANKRDGRRQQHEIGKNTIIESGGRSRE